MITKNKDAKSRGKSHGVCKISYGHSDMGIIPGLGIVALCPDKVSFESTTHRKWKQMNEHVNLAVISFPSFALIHLQET